MVEKHRVVFIRWCLPLLSKTGKWEAKSHLWANPCTCKWRRGATGRNSLQKWNALPSSIIQSMWTILTKHLQQPGFEPDTDGQTRIEADNDSPQQASIFTLHTCSSLPFPYVSPWPRTTNPNLFSPLQNLKSQIQRKAELVFQKKKNTQVSFPKKVILTRKYTSSISD